MNKVGKILGWGALGAALTYLWIALTSQGIGALTSFVNPFTGDRIYTMLGYFIMVCIITPLWEEAAWRYAPIELAKELEIKLNLNVLLPFVVLSSAIFGWVHGPTIQTMIQQGAGGLILSWIYIKSGYRYWASVLAHFLWNSLAMFVIPALPIIIDKISKIW